MASWLTEDERIRLHMDWPDPDAVLGWANVSMTQLSIARHSGGATVNGHRYTYFPATDELWRDDVVKLVKAWRKEAKAAEPQPAQDGLDFGGDA